MKDESTFDIGKVLEMLKKRMNFIIKITIACTLISGVVSFFMIKPTYEASSSIIVGKQKEEGTKAYTQSDVMMYQQLVKTYAIIAQSDSVANLIVEKSNTNYTSDEIKKMLNVVPQANTQVLQIKMQGKNAEEITNIVNSASEAFIEEAKRALPTGGDIQILDKAKEPKGAIKPKKLLNIMIAFFIGLIGSIGIVFIRECLDKTVKSEEDIEEITGFPVIGSIYKFDK